jgi:hypothetical protein
VLGPHHPDTLRCQLNLVQNLSSQYQRAEAVRLLQQMEPNLLGWIGQELYSTETGTVRQQLVSSQATFQDVVLTLATSTGDSDARRLAGAVMLRFKQLQEECRYRSLAIWDDPRVISLTVAVEDNEVLAFTSGLGHHYEALPRRRRNMASTV